MLLFFSLFHVPAEQVSDVRIALLIVGLNLALSFPLSLFDAILWASQRFDVLNAIEIPTVVLRAGLTYLLIGGPNSLVTLALITLLSTVCATVPKAVFCLRADHSLRFGLSYLRVESARSLFGYGIWFFVLSAARLANNLISPLIVGARLSVEAVTPYSFATRLTGYAGQVLIASTGVLTPVTTSCCMPSRSGSSKSGCSWRPANIPPISPSSSRLRSFCWAARS